MIKLSENILHIFYALYIYLVSAYFTLKQIFTQRHKPIIPSCEGRVALITGGGRGIGFEVSTNLISNGMTVIVVGLKDDIPGFKALQKIDRHKVHFLECDLSNLDEVKQLKQAFLKLQLPLHVLILNAGIMFSPRIEYKGFESHFVINYLSQFYLAHLMLSLLKNSTNDENPCRIVTLGSCLHYCGNINFQDLQGRNFYDRHAAYCQTKLAMVMFAKSLSRYSHKEGSNILVNSVHPAVVFSNLMEHTIFKLLPLVGWLVLETTKTGCYNVLYAAVDPRISTSGNYFDNCCCVTPSKNAQSIQDQDKLWQVSCHLLGIKNF